MSDPFDYGAVEDGCARTIADVIEGATVFASGTTASVTDASPLVVPLADDFSEVGGPFVTALIRNVDVISQPGNERLHLFVECGIWRERADLPANRHALWTDYTTVRESFLAHSKAYLAEPRVQSSVVTKVTAPVTRALPAHGTAQRDFLYLAFEVEVKANRHVVFEPA